jgi:hypothetical protein
MKYIKRASGIGCAFNPEAIERMLKMQFEKKPVVIEARQHVLCATEYMEELASWCNGRVVPERNAIAIDTLEGIMFADLGDWIIKEPFPTANRQFYPCKPDIFEASYKRTYND